MLTLPLTFERRAANPAIRSPWLLVLLHGLGDNEHSLLTLTAHWPDRFHLLSLRAPERMRPGAYAWFDYQLSPGGTRTIDSAQESRSRGLIGNSIAQAQAHWGVPPARTVICGFSQGAIMALSLLLTRPDLVDTAIVWHGRLLAEIQPFIAPAQALQGKHLWVSHGTQDSIIPLSAAQLLRKSLQGLGLHMHYEEFVCGHEVRGAELSHTEAWLNQRVMVSV